MVLKNLSKQQRYLFWVDYYLSNCQISFIMVLLQICMPAPSLEFPPLSIPGATDVFRFVKGDSASFMQNEEFLKKINHEESQLIEEYIFNIYKKEGLVCIDNLKLCIRQRLINLELFGELTVEYYQKDGIKNYRTCEFVLGTQNIIEHFMTSV